MTGPKTARSVQDAGKTRDGQHEWDGSKCSKCGKTRVMHANVEDFPDQAATGPTHCNAPIQLIESIVMRLVNKLKDNGVSIDAMHDLLNNSLIAVCPKCNEYCAGKALLMLPMLSGVSNMLFTGNSGGFERILDGKCLNYLCYSTQYELFWCPDLDSNLMRKLSSQGINIDPNIQSTRDHVWRPKR